jgi:hypothetical protein
MRTSFASQRHKTSIESDSDDNKTKKVKALDEQQQQQQQERRCGGHFDDQNYLRLSRIL